MAQPGTPSAKRSATARAVAASALALALTGCILAGVHVDEEAYRAMDWSERKTWDVCVYGKDRPHLLNAVEKEFDRYGIDFNFKPGPQKYAGRDAACLFASVTPECPTHLILRLPSGYGAGSLLVGCQAGFTFARLNRVDAVILIDWGMPSIVVHEFYHAAGCLHDIDGERECAAKLQILKSRLPPASPAPAVAEPDRTPVGTPWPGPKEAAPALCE